MANQALFAVKSMCRVLGVSVQVKSLPTLRVRLNATDFGAREFVALGKLLAHDSHDVLGVAVVLGEDQRLGHLGAAGEDLGGHGLHRLTPCREQPVDFGAGVLFGLFRHSGLPLAGRRYHLRRGATTGINELGREVERRKAHHPGASHHLLLHEEGSLLNFDLVMAPTGADWRPI